MLRKITLLLAMLLLAFNIDAQVLTASPDSLWFGATVAGTSSAPQTSVLTGSYLTPSSGTITLFTPSNFELYDRAAWANSCTISYTGGTLATSTIYIRFSAPATAGSYSGLLHIMGGGTRDTIVLNGTGVAACSGTPSAGIATASPSTGGAATSFTLNCSGYPSVAGLSFQWQDSSGSTGGSWVNLSGATNSTHSFTGITHTTFYRCMVSCSYSGLSSYSTADTIYALPVSASCTPSPSSAGASCSTFTMSFASVLLCGIADSINDVLACDGSGYRDRTSLSCTMGQNCTYTMTIAYGGGSTTMTNYTQWWIDFNNNGTFESSESVGGSGSAFTSGSVAIAIPTTAPLGTFRMRGVCSYSGAAYTYPTLDPCMSGYVYGEARDYFVHIVARPAFTTTSSLSFPPILGGTTSSALPFTFSSSFLSPSTGTLTITAPTNFSVSATSTGTFSSSYTITYTGGVLPSTTGYAVFTAPSAAGSYSGCIYISGGSSSATCIGSTGTSTAACSGLPVPGTISSSTSGAGSSTAITITNTGYSTAAGINFQWQSATTGAWSNISGATNAVLSFTGITATTTYRCLVTCSYSGLTDSTNTVTITLNCSSTPVAGHVYSLHSSCTVCLDTLRLSGTSAIGGLAYQWQQSPDGSFSWSNISGATNSAYIFTTYGDRYYRCQVRCIATGASALSDTFHRSFSYTITSHSVTGPFASLCSSLMFRLYANGNSPFLYTKTWYGDGTTDSLMMSGSSSSSLTNYHAYPLGGTYTVKQVLYFNNVAQDSVSFSQTATFCRNLRVNYRIDADGDSNIATWEPYNLTYVGTEIDSDGVAIDTIYCTSGFSYAATGPSGTIYSFRPVVFSSSSYYLTVPSTGILRDTISTAVLTYPEKIFGLNCTGGSCADLYIYGSVRASTTAARANMYLLNNTCFSVSPSIQMFATPKYTHCGSYSSGGVGTASVSGGIITWSASPMNLAGGSRYLLEYLLPTTGYTITAGDTIHTAYRISPTTSDCDSTNNAMVKVDTVRASCDPNHIESTPGGLMLAGTQLRYTVEFENDGNDTAQNIYVMDTLSGYLDASTFKPVFSSHTMYVETQQVGGNTIVKFDFPNIKLLDSTHHGLCNGMFQYDITLRNGLPDGTVIPSRVGIYFDDNDVVMTNQWDNVIGHPVVVNEVHEVAPASFTLYPNPATNVLQLSTASTTAEVTITNQLGQQFLYQQLNGNNNQLNISALPAGIYFVKLTSGKGSTVKQFVKN